MLSVSDFNAEKKWRSLPKEFQKRILSNVFCFKCGETTIVDYSVKDDNLGIILEGKCQQCDSNVARFIED